ncbi:class I SAM-dependent methyltransferase [Paenibacillus radicis (ex Xue et al. 2023)]|uniref:Class I SAM-dependent methyltransferase n=1 Tax=Paenibacillus radicis (ex Xue et al. 2023) TaxID=2972489 RepID=A0ABT1YF24_9BACL|nr:class I SAM-dependent methyltransferase [Paenibacillus radicis (ex Xue et al. 2023)]MCR8631793.1 class I SAM-dependent methyltransferase [Paenibacillus radicis (ex Xue et al. 2023)]
MEENKYKNTAHLYDLDPRNIVNDDINFYINYALRINGEILEIACGTGRVTLPLARAGYKITGIDLSEDMIAVLNEKLLKEEKGTRELVEVFIADMTNFDLGKKFPLIIIPFRAFQLLTEMDQQNSFFDRIKEHLTMDGIFIINTYKLSGQLDDSWVRPEKEDWVVEDPKSNTRVRRTHIQRAIDVSKQINYPELIYYVEEVSGRINKYVEKLAMKYYYEDQLRELLQLQGFKIEEELGYYDGRSINEGPELIFVCSQALTESCT